MTEGLFERARVMHGMSRRTAEVISCEKVDRMYRVTLESSEFEQLSSPGPHDHVKLFFPLKDGTLPEFGEDAQGKRTVTPGTVSRDMTVKEQEGKRIVLDIVEHESGPMIEWARSVESGSQVIVAGPRGSLLPPHPPKIILGADGASLPALYRWVEELANDVDITIIVNGTELDVEDYLAPVTRGRTLAIHTIDDTAEAAEALAILRDIAPGADTYVWFGGEAGWLLPIRRWLRNESGVIRGNIKVDGYWKAGVSGRDHHEPIDPNETD